MSLTFSFAGCIILQDLVLFRLLTFDEIKLVTPLFVFQLSVEDKDVQIGKDWCAIYKLAETL